MADRETDSDTQAKDRQVDADPDRSGDADRGRLSSSDPSSQAERGGLSRFPALLLPASAVIAGFVLLGTEFLDTFRLVGAEGDVVDVAGGIERHGFSLGLMGLSGAALAAAAALTRSRAAAIGCAAAGIVALILIAIIDLPDIGTIDLVRDPDGELMNAEAEPTGALWTSMIAAATLALSGVAMFIHQRTNK